MRKTRDNFVHSLIKREHCSFPGWKINMTPPFPARAAHVLEGGQGKYCRNNNVSPLRREQNRKLTGARMGLVSERAQMGTLPGWACFFLTCSWPLPYIQVPPAPRNLSVLLRLGTPIPWGEGVQLSLQVCDVCLRICGNTKSLSQSIF